jgi:hypothetical protein
MKIQLILVDDWELRGDGSGDVRRIQFDTMSQLLAIYESYGIRASVNAEVMQQLYHRQFGVAHADLAVVANEWDAFVISMYKRGHDVQLHIHSQWLNAQYESGRWVLPSAWSILKHTPNDARSMIQAGKIYLEKLIRTVNPHYRCVSFRSGGWCIAPSDTILTTLADAGIMFDMSIVAGIAYRNAKIQLDYRYCDESFLPYYPDMRDARRVSAVPTRIVCFPTFSFKVPLEIIHRDLFRLWNVASKMLGLPPRRRDRAPNETPVAASDRNAPAEPEYGVWNETFSAKLLKRFRPSHHIADLSALTVPLMERMLETIRAKAESTGWPVVPVILENHTKDIGDFAPIEKFARLLSMQQDIEVITLAEVADNLARKVYSPITASAER